MKSSDRVTVSLWETSTTGDDNHLLPALFTGRDILAFAHCSPALYLRLRYDSRRAASTRCRPGSRGQRWLRWCTMLPSVCMSRAGLDGKWPDTQFHLTRIEQIGNLRDRRDSPTGRMSWEDHELERMEPAGMEPLGYWRHGWADPRW